MLLIQIKHHSFFCFYQLYPSQVLHLVNPVLWAHKRWTSYKLRENAWLDELWRLCCAVGDTLYVCTCQGSRWDKLRLLRETRPKTAFPLNRVTWGCQVFFDGNRENDCSTPIRRVALMQRKDVCFTTVKEERRRLPHYHSYTLTIRWVTVSEVLQLQLLLAAKCGGWTKLVTKPVTKPDNKAATWTSSGLRGERTREVCLLNTEAQFPKHTVG